MVDTRVLKRMVFGLLSLLVLVALIVILGQQPAEAGGSGDYPPPVTGDWIISSDTQVWDETIQLSGDLVVRSGATLDIDNVLLVMNCSFEGQFHIEVLDGGGMDIADSNLTALDTMFPYYFVVRDNGSLGVLNTTLEWMGWDGALLYEQLGLSIFSNNTSIIDSTFQFNRAGLYIENSWFTMDGNFFVDNHYGVWMYKAGPVLVTDSVFKRNNMGLIADSSTVLFLDCVLTENNLKGVAGLSSNILMDNTSIEETREIALSGWDTDIIMMNGSLEGETYGLTLDMNSSMVSFNGTIDRFDILFNDYLSHLTVYWYVDIEVVWWSDLSPVDNATVNVTDSDGLEIGNGTTGADGLLKDLLVPGYDANRSKFVFYTPIDISANASGLIGNGTTDLEGPTRATVMIDDIPPGVNVTSPAMEEFYNMNVVDLKGVMWDNESGPSRVEVSLDGDNYTMANGSSIWDLTLTLEDGLHLITVRAWDLAGNSKIVNFNITIDTVPPIVEIGAPEDGLVINLTAVWINGSVERGANITIGDRVLNNTNGTFGFYFDLEEGVNNITIEAVDLAGNVNFTTIHVTRDTMVDPMVLEPGNGTSVNNATLVVKGRTEPGTFIRLTWTWLNVSGNNTTLEQHNISLWAGPNGNFTFTLHLSEGESNFSFHARDVLNNTLSMNLTYFLDSTPPKLVLTSPPSALYYTNKNGVNIKGLTEEGARVFLDQQELQLYDLRFSIRVEVFSGSNNFTLWAVDNANNTIRINLTIIVDKDPPFLNISRPFEPIVKTTGKYITITGFTEGNATVCINGASYNVRDDGYFSIKRSLVFGENKFTITAKDKAGNPTSVDRTVIRERPPESRTRFYIGLSVPIVALVVILLVTLFYLNRQGRLEGVKRFLRRGKGEDDELEDLDDEDAPEDLDLDGPPPELPDLPPMEELTKEGSEHETPDEKEGGEKAEENVAKQDDGKKEKKKK